MTGLLKGWQIMAGIAFFWEVAGQWLWSGANVIAIFVARYYSMQELQNGFLRFGLIRNVFANRFFTGKMQ
jgi:hypothetical protein